MFIDVKSGAIGVIEFFLIQDGLLHFLLPAILSHNFKEYSPVSVKDTVDRKALMTHGCRQAAVWPCQPAT